MLTSPFQKIWLFLCLGLAPAMLLAQAQTSQEESNWKEKASNESAQAVPHPNNGIIITKGYVADSDNVRDPHVHYQAGFQAGLDDAAERAEQSYEQHPDEYNYYNESIYSQGYEDGYHAYGGAGGARGGAGGANR